MMQPIDESKDEGNLPPNWTRCTIGEITLPVQKIDPRRHADRDIAYIDISSIDNGSNRIAEAKSLRLSGAPDRARQIVRQGDVLFSLVRPYLRNIASVRAEFDEQIASTGFSVLRPAAGIEPSYLFLSAISREFVDGLSGVQYGVSYPAVKDDQVRAQKIALPPSEEQRRIVDKIEMLFAQLDKGEEALQVVQNQLARYRQSVLKVAVTGQLTGSDHATWKPVKLGELLEDIRYGTAKKCHPKTEGIAVLRIPNVANGEIDLQDLKYTQLDDREIRTLGLKKGDLLIVRSNGSANLVGRGAVVDDDAVGLAFAGYLIRLRVDQKRLLPDFLQLVLSSPVIRARIERQARSTSGVHNINSGEVKAIAFDLPPFDVQSEIVELVAEHMAKIRDLDAWCQTELKRSAALRQSILKDAFTGRLVAQNPDDEPAADLLTRIKAASGAKPTRRSKSAAERAHRLADPRGIMS